MTQDIKQMAINEVWPMIKKQGLPYVMMIGIVIVQYHVNTKRTKEDKADKTALNLRITELEGRMLDCYTNHQDQMIEAMDKYTEAIQDLEMTIMKKIR